MILKHLKQVEQVVRVVLEQYMMQKYIKMEIKFILN